jgi:hypothetical protein
MDKYKTEVFVMRKRLNELEKYERLYKDLKTVVDEKEKLEN